MWRIYNSKKDGVRVKTTVKKLFHAIFDGSDNFSSLKYFIRNVEYKDKQEIIDCMKSITFSEIIFGGKNNILQNYYALKGLALIMKMKFEFLLTILVIKKEKMDCIK